MSDPSGLRLVAITANRPGVVRLDGETMPSITAALERARPGSTVEIGRGRYTSATETFPLHPPAGVTLQGPVPPKIPGQAKKLLPTPPPAELVADGVVLVVDEPDVTMAHLTVTNRRPDRGPAVRISGATGATLDSCDVSGAIEATDASTLRIDWCTLAHGSLTVSGVEGFRLTGGTITGTHGADPLVDMADATDVRIAAAALTETRSGVAVVSSSEVTIGGCAVLADDDAVWASDSSGVSVSGNRLRGRHGIRFVGCTDGAVTANGIEFGVAPIELHGCTGVEIGFNHTRPWSHNAPDEPSNEPSN
ncbi:MAG: DUF1565 domain-containing protein [Actinobacteria bacterium]|nr:DUF1565 domain-containing protein [Actinomycetota bacterium]